MSWRAAFSKCLTDWPLLMAIGISLAAAALRIPPLGESLWLDELHTAWCAVGPLDEVSLRAALGNQAPLFFWLEWFSFGIVGPNELSLRWISLVSGSLLPLAIFLFARRWKLEIAGLVAAGLIAVDTLSIFYATEARPYAALQLLAISHVALTAELSVQSTRRLRIAWVAIGVAAFYLHFTAALLVLADGLFLILARALRPLKSRAEVMGVVLDLAIVCALCLPQLATVRAVFAHRANWAAFIAREPIGTAIEWFPLPAWWWCGLVLIATLGICWKIRPSSTDTQLPAAHLCVLVVVWLLIPLFLAWLATWTDTARLFYHRYLVSVLPAAALLAGLCIFVIPWRLASVVAGILTVICAAWSGGIFERIAREGAVIAPRGEDWRGCVAWLNDRLPQSGFPVLVYSGLIEADELKQPHDELLEDYCLAPVNSLYPLEMDRGDLFPLALHEPGKVDQVAEMLMVHRGGAWLIVRSNEKMASRIADEILVNMKRAAVAGAEADWQAAESKSFGNVQALLLTSNANRASGPADPSMAGP